MRKEANEFRAFLGQFSSLTKNEPLQVYLNLASRSNAISWLAAATQVHAVAEPTPPASEPGPPVETSLSHDNGVDPDSTILKPLEADSAEVGPQHTEQRTSGGESSRLELSASTAPSESAAPRNDKSAAGLHSPHSGLQEADIDWTQLDHRESDEHSLEDDESPADLKREASAADLADCNRKRKRCKEDNVDSAEITQVLQPPKSQKLYHLRCVKFRCLAPLLSTLHILSDC